MHLVWERDQAGNVTGIIIGRKRKGRGSGVGGRWVTANPVQVVVVLLEATQSQRPGPQSTASFSYSFVKHCVRVGDTLRRLLSPVLLWLHQRASGHAHSSPGDEAHQGMGAPQTSGNPCLLPASCCSEKPTPSHSSSTPKA